MSKPASSTLERKYPGASADQPKDIPKRGWLQIVKRAWAESKLDQVPLLAAGVAFYSFLSLFPAMIAAVTVYGLVASPETVARQTEAVAQALPEAAASIITGQMEAITAVHRRYVSPPFPAWTAIDVDRLIPERGITEIKIVAKRPAPAAR